MARVSLPFLYICILSWLSVIICYMRSMDLVKASPSFLAAPRALLQSTWSSVVLTDSSRLSGRTVVECSTRAVCQGGASRVSTLSYRKPLTGWNTMPSACPLHLFFPHLPPLCPHHKSPCLLSFPFLPSTPCHPSAWFPGDGFGMNGVDHVGWYMILSRF